nr:ATP-binding protein [Methanocella sp. CWC-04]
MEVLACNSNLVEGIRQNDIEEVRTKISSFYSTEPRFSRIYLTDPNGTVIAGYPASNADGIKDINAGTLALIKTNGPWMGKPIIEGKNNVTGLDIAVPVKDENKNVIGLLIGSLDINKVSTQVKSIGQRYETETYIVDERGRPIYHDNKTYKNGISDLSFDPAVKRVIGGESGNIKIPVYVYGKEKYAAYAFEPGSNWGVVVEYDASYVDGLIMGELEKYIPAFLTMLSIIAVLAYFVGSSVTKPIMDMADACEKMEARGCRITLPADRKDEIGALASSINSMSEALMKEREELSIEKERLDAILASAGEKICIVDGSDILLWANDRMRTRYISKKDIEGLKLDELIQKVDPGQEDIMLEEGVFRNYYKGSDIRGRKRIFEATIVPLGHVYGAGSKLLSLRDVTERDAILKVSTIMAGAASMDEMLNESLNMLKDMLNLRMAAVFLVDEKENAIRIRAYTGMEERHAKAMGYQEIGPDSKVSGYAAYIRRPVVVGDIRIHPRRVRSKDLIDSGLLSVAAFPLIIGEKVVGVLDAATERLNDFTREDVRFLTSFSGQLAMTVQRMRSEEKLEKEKNNAELYVDLMSHDINNMNQSAAGFLEIALMRAGLPEDARHMLESALSSIKNSTVLIENVRKIQRISSGDSTMERMDLNSVILQAITNSLAHPEKKVSVDFKERFKAPVIASPLLVDVFLNIIGNSIKYSGIEVDIRIDVDISQIDGKDFYRVSICDNGYGIPDELKIKLFRRFQRGNQAIRGTGLGLYIVRKVVESCGGWVEVKDRIKGDHTKGARFDVYLPVPP